MAAARSMLDFERLVDSDQDPLFPASRWRGASGRVYCFNYFRLNAMPPCGQGVYVIARWHDASESWQPLWIGEGDGVDLAVMQGSTLPLATLHVHVHLLARSKAERLAIAADLRNAWPRLPAAEALASLPRHAAEAAD
jgi:hypothetical protein